jgi:hypothetical protein
LFVVSLVAACILHRRWRGAIQQAYMDSSRK